MLIHEYMHAGSHMSDLQAFVPCTFEANHDRPASGVPQVNWASKNPENYRFCALDGDPAKRSEAVHCTTKQRAWPTDWSPLP